MLRHDLRYGVRSLLTTPGFTCVALLSLALAIGASAAGVSILNALFARDVAVPAAAELIAVATINPDRPDDRNPLSLAQFEEARRRNPPFSQMFAWRDALLRNIEIDGARSPGNVNEVSGDYFVALGVRPFLGRLLTSDDVATIGKGTSARVAVLDYRCWEQRFGRDPDVLGKILIVDGTPLTIVGVTPKDFLGLNIVTAPDATVPIGFDTGRIPDPVSPGVGSMNYYVGARLTRGATVDTASTYLTAIWPAILNATLPPAVQGAQRARLLATRISVESARTGTTGGSLGLRRQLARPLMELLALSGLVLLVAYLNLAGVVLMRATARQWELRLRASLGASRIALMRIVVVEGVLLSATGAALGLAAAFWTGPLLLRSLLRFEPLKPMAFDATPDFRVLVVAALVAIGIAVVCAVVPAWRVIGRDVIAGLHQEARAVRGGTTVFQKAIMCAQVALAFVLTTGALLFGRTLYNLRTVDPGFRVNGVLMMRLFPQVKQGIIPNRTAYYQELAGALAAIPGVDAVSYVHIAPLDAANPTPIKGSRFANASDAIVDRIGPGFFQTMGLTMLHGRDFDWHDDEHTPRVAVISDSLAKHLFPGIDPIGQTLDVPSSPDGTGLRIVGVVSSASLWRLQQPQPRAVYLPLMQAPAYNNFAVALHTNGDAGALAPAANRVVESRRYQYSFSTQPLANRMRYALGDERMLSAFSTFFAGLTMALASAGLYGLLSYSVTRRRSELGVRLAMGAQRRDIQFLIVREAARLVLVGLAVGVAAAVAGVRVTAGILYGVAPYDPLTFTASAIGLVAITLIAVYFPSRRASRIDPLIALRCE